MKDPRVFLRIFFVLTAFGLMSLLAMLSRCSLQKIREVDVVQLIGVGTCFGGAIVSFVAYFPGSRSSTD